MKSVSIASRVRPASFPVSILSSPRRAFTRVDLPTFGRPIIEIRTRKSFSSSKSSLSSAISIISLPFFGNISVLAYRLSEMLGTVIIFLLPEIISISKNKKIGFLFFILFVGMLFFLNNIHNNFGF